eukprot:TRINITY_DN59131_c0_g1_i1.p1 TRINITY_DN59131_c0_g1~~TRINITY_DN59131_c0_g1_i1.p1  ORF type:complete len:549 (+),score=28.11 TRINITY_DN59131_c0_g1_i1:113-1759(+)
MLPQQNLLRVTERCYPVVLGRSEGNQGTRAKIDSFGSPSSSSTDESASVELTQSSSVAFQSIPSCACSYADERLRILELMVTRSLPSQELLRATKAYQALGRFGVVFRSAQVAVRGGRVSDPSDMFPFSFKTKRIHSFWSHSWHAPSTWKILTLLLHYNHFPASFVGTLASLVGCVLSFHGYLPSMLPLHAQLVCPWSLIFGIFAFLLTLVLWCPNEDVFVDRMCIHQTDDMLKAQGVQCIGAFLSHSESMLILWDKSYATRLWCVFEVAAFANIAGESIHARMQVKPIICSRIYVVIMAVCCVNWGGNVLFMKAFELTYRLMIPVLPCLVTSRLLRSYHRDVLELSKQLAEFNIGDLNCFCCNVGHIDPKTQQCIACDREVIEGSIQAWFGSLHQFETYVRNNLPSVFLHQMGRTMSIPMQWLVGTQLPVFWAHLDIAAVDVRSENFEAGLICIGEAFSIWFCLNPLIFSCLNVLIKHVHKEERGWFGELVASIVVYIITLLCIAALYGIWITTRYYVFDNQLLGVALAFFVSACFTAVLYRWNAQL